MATKAKPAKGSLLQVGDGGSPETFSTVAEVLSFGGVPLAVKEIDVTSQDSTAREFITDALPESPTTTFECNFVGSSATQQRMRTNLSAGTVTNFKYVLNDHATTPTTFTFAAVITEATGPSFGGPGDVYKTSFTLRRSGALTVVQWAPA